MLIDFITGSDIYIRFGHLYIVLDTTTGNVVFNLAFGYRQGCLYIYIFSVL